MDLFLSPAYGPFLAALLVMVGCVALEGLALITIGGGMSEALEALTPDWLSSAANASWIPFRQVPFAIAVILALLFFGCAGLALQATMVGLAGGALPALVAVPLALVAAWLGLGTCARLIRAHSVKDAAEVTLADFSGKKAVILSPRCTPTLAAEVRITDDFGKNHTLMVVPAEGEGEFRHGDEIVLQQLIDRMRFTAAKAK